MPVCRPRPLAALHHGELEGPLAVELQRAHVQGERRLDPLVDGAREQHGEALGPGVQPGRIGLREHRAQGAAHLGRRQLLPRVEPEAGVEHGERHQLPLRRLLRRQLRAGLGGERLPHPGEAEALQETLQEGHHQRLRHVGDHRQGALQVAADGGVAHGLLAHVPRLEEQRSRGVGPIPHAARPQARLHVLPRDLRGLATAQHFLRGLDLAVEGLFDRHHLERHAQLLAEDARGAPRPLPGVAGGHVEGLDEGPRGVLGASGILGASGLRVHQLRRPPGDEEGQHGVAAARKRDPQGTEGPGLLEVVLHPQRQRLDEVVQHLLARRAHGPAGRRQEEVRPRRGRVGETRTVARGAVAPDHRHRHLLALEPLAVAAPGGGLPPGTEGAVQVQHAGRPPLAEAGRLQQQPAVLEHEAAAVEDQPVLPAHHVGVDERRLVVRRARGQHLPPGRHHPHPEGGRRDVHHHLGPRVAAPPHGAVRRPHVLTDLDGHQAEIEFEEIVAQRHAAGLQGQPGSTARERARLVEDVVRGELLLGHQTQNGPTLHHRRAVEDLPPHAHGDPHHEDHRRHRRLRRLRREPLQLHPLGVQERAPLHEILGRIPTHHLLGEAADRHPLRRHGPGLHQHPVDVRPDRSHRGIDAAHPDLDQPHALAPPGAILTDRTRRCNREINVMIRVRCLRENSTTRS